MYKLLAGLTGIALSLAAMAAPAAAETRIRVNPDGTQTFMSSQCFSYDTPTPLFMGSTGTYVSVSPLVVGEVCVRSLVTEIPPYHGGLGYGHFHFTAQAANPPERTEVVRDGSCTFSKFPSAFTAPGLGHSIVVITPSGKVTGFCEVTRAQMEAYMAAQG